MKKLNLFIGVAALLLAFALNARHALNDYGVSDPSNKLHPEVLAQTNTAGGGSSGGSSSGGNVCYNTITTAPGRQVKYCGNCSWLDGKPTLFSGSGSC